jgi:hypothetical protein
MNKNNLPTDVIPKGDYCYSGKGSCPYWSIRDDKPPQESGYCKFLEMGDWDYNSSEEKTIVDQNGNELSPSEMLFGISLLWDQCKACGINMYTEEEFKELCK